MPWIILMKPKMKLLVEKIGWFEEVKPMLPFDIETIDLQKPIKTLKNYCHQHKVDVILCLQYETILYHYQNSRSEINMLPWWLPCEAASKMEDKFHAYNWFRDNGYGAFLPKICGLDETPFIIKLGNGRSGNSVFYVQDNEDLQRYLPLPNIAIVQAYIASPYEYAFHFIADDGRIILHETYQHDFQQQHKSLSHYIRGHRDRNLVSNRYQLSDQHFDVLSSIIQKLN